MGLNNNTWISGGGGGGIYPYLRYWLRLAIIKHPFPGFFLGKSSRGYMPPKYIPFPEKII